MTRKKKIRVAVLMGGPSAEHEVSMHTGGEIIKNLDPGAYTALPVVIDKSGRWLATSEPNSWLTARASTGERRMSVARIEMPVAVVEKADVIFIALHGAYGEDGTVQGLLETLGVPYTGSGVLASALGMDKPRSLAVFREAGLRAPEFGVVAADDERKSTGRMARHWIGRLGLPLVVKPADHGSSVGVSIVRDRGQFAPAIREAGRYSREIIVQKYIKGRELTCGVLEGNKGALMPLPPVEIRPNLGGFYDYQSKYADGGSDHIVPPAGLSARAIAAVQAAACTAHRAIGCRGMSRTDFIRDPRGGLYVLEINTIPGMTATSLLPQAAAAAGISFPRLLDMIIRSALKK